MAENISVPNLKITVEEFEQGIIKLSKIKSSEALNYLDEALIYFNHHVVNGKIVQIGDENCVNVVEVVEDFLKTGKLNVAKYSTFQEITKLENIYNNKFLTMSIPSTKNVMKEGERGIIFGYRGLYKKGHVFNVVKKDGGLILIDAQKSNGRAVLNEGYKSFKYLKTK
ncbi:hypothetical protein OX283_009600 [Flavobacterium sp. SUN052]|uniref:hypothetical protein n=1 Tax=Flavobacterium sp. SUN052 TaxID=3002441 RepID=UPI00237D37BC|nr:hypothetical protein [Flavobacterium sp. SUN052]MEC4004909.1 hypothetical protein [Flavobacterium sp. SUN052]